MDSIKKAIAERGLYKRAHDNKVHERTMQTHEEMIIKDASKIDNNVAGAFHDKDNITESYMEIKNKEEIERFSKESKDGDKFCNVVVEVKEKLSKQIVQLEKDLAKLEAQSIADHLSLGWLLEEIHVTWAHLEKKQTRLQLYTKSFEEFVYLSPSVVES
nr:hypothetical protein [Tanacetum cinerariifolium]